MSELTLVVGNKNHSSWSLRPWLVMKVAGIPFEEITVLLDQPDTAAKIAPYSPSGRVPALVDGDLKVWDSLAIIEYLAEKFPKAELWPSNPAARAKARSISAEMHAGFMAMRNTLNTDIRGRFSREWGADVQADVNRVCAIWRDCLASGGPFLFGRWTAVDAMFAPVATRFRTWPVPLDPVCAAYRDALLNMPAFKEWEAAALVEPVMERYRWTGAVRG